MAKDPAFLFYDGDAAKDVSHLNRLERGCYFDLIQAQRKFGRLSLNIIKKILAKDFELCWESVKICLTYDKDMYFIQWVEDSVIKRKEYSESRRKNRKSSLPTTLEKTYDNHMENEIVIENENVKDNEIFMVPEMKEQFRKVNPKYFFDKDNDFPALMDIAGKIKKMDCIRGLITDNDNSEKIKTRWGEMIKQIASDPHFSKYSISQINKHFQSITQSFSNGKKHIRNNSGKPIPEVVDEGGFGKL